ncbi:MAG: GNAT family N-acetyltransferase [Actinomycetota bacterium]
MPSERFETERLVLRRFSRRDVSALTEAVQASLPALNEWLPWAHPGYRREDASLYVRDSLEAWKEGRAYDWAIRLIGNPRRHIGNISTWPVSRLTRTGEIGYWIRTDETGKGMAAEATGAVVRLGFDELGFHKLVLRVAIGNLASERVAEKLGFAREGVLREELLIRGRWVDHTLFSLLDREYQHRYQTGVRS